jgi:hypothetical protein
MGSFLAFNPKPLKRDVERYLEFGAWSGDITNPTNIFIDSDNQFIETTHNIIRNEVHCIDQRFVFRLCFSASH